MYYYNIIHQNVNVCRQVLLPLLNSSSNVCKCLYYFLHITVQCSTLHIYPLSSYDLLLKSPELQRRRDELLGNKCPNFNDEIALRKIPTLKNTTEQRHVVNLV
jgi:hypothetical protein